VGEVRAKVTFEGGLKFSGVAGSGHEVIMDGPEAHGGSDSAATPMELVLMGLGGCTGMDAVSILRKKKQHIESFEMLLKGVRAEGHPMRYTDIDIEFVVKGNDIDEKAVERAVTLSMDRYCSVKACLEQETKVNFSWRIEEP
jgi:putative redox protein